MQPPVNASSVALGSLQTCQDISGTRRRSAAAPTYSPLMCLLSSYQKSARKFKRFVGVLSDKGGGILTERAVIVRHTTKGE